MNKLKRKTVKRNRSRKHRYKKIHEKKCNWEIMNTVRENGVIKYKIRNK